MAHSISLASRTILSPFQDSARFRPVNPFLRRTQFGNISHHQKPFRTLTVASFGPGQVQFLDPENLRDLIDRAEGLLYTVADAAVSAAPDSVTTTTSTKQNDWLTGIANYMETILKFLKGGLSALHVPYAYGFAIILLTVLVKAATFPLSKKQVESAMAMRTLQPQVKAIQERYAGDQERIQLETARLYKLAGINPLAGCLPTLATIPVWIGLYRALSNVADEGLLSEGFFWIPSLAGPTTVAARQSGSGTSWLFPFIDGQPPLGWSDTLAYLVLPVLLVISQYISVQIMQSSQKNDPSQKSSQAITNFLPLMIGYFALSVPSGLSLYWFTNNILSTAQQVFLQKSAAANNPAKQLNFDDIKEELPKIQESLFQSTSVKELKVEEKPKAQGYRPGERFKQLKEQEAKRKQQREAEKAKELSLTNGEKEGATSVQVGDKSLEGSHEANSVTTNGASGSEPHALNGDCSSSDSVSRIDESQDSVNINSVKDQQHLGNDPEKEKAIIGSADSANSPEDKHQDRSA